MVENGIYAASLTPLNEDLTINHEELAFHCFDLISRGCQGVVLFGTTGEGASFSVNEKIDALQKLISKGFDPDKIILGNGSSSIADTITLAKASLNCAAFLVAPPCYFKNISNEGLLAFYREVIKKCGNNNLQILLYHIPQYTCVPITLDVVETLKKEFPDIIVGIKESAGDFEFTKTLLQKIPNFKVFVGNERQLAEALEHGGSGSICGIANLYPELLHAIYEKKGTFKKELDEIFKSLEGHQFIPFCKLQMEKKRKNWRRVRPPLWQII